MSKEEAVMAVVPSLPAVIPGTGRRFAVTQNTLNIIAIDPGIENVGCVFCSLYESGEVEVLWQGTSRLAPVMDIKTQAGMAKAVAHWWRREIEGNFALQAQRDYTNYERNVPTYLLIEDQYLAPGPKFKRGQELRDIVTCLYTLANIYQSHFNLVHVYPRSVHSELRLVGSKTDDGNVRLKDWERLYKSGFVADWNRTLPSKHAADAFLMVVYFLRKMKNNRSVEAIPAVFFHNGVERILQAEPAKPDERGSGGGSGGGSCAGGGATIAPDGGQQQQGSGTQTA